MPPFAEADTRKDGFSHKQPHVSLTQMPPKVVLADALASPSVLTFFWLSPRAIILNVGL